LRGSSGGELFSILDVSGDGFTVVPHEIPLDAGKGKSIDDILILGNTMILVDNIVFPKYLSEYDIGDTAHPRHVATRKLPNNGVYEHIRKGDLANNRLVLLSSSTGMNGAYNFVNIFDRYTDMETGISLAFTHEEFLWEEKRSREWEQVFDICLLGECLLVLTDKRLCQINLNVPDLWERPETVSPDPSKLIHPNPLHQRYLETLEANVEGMDRMIKLDAGHCLLTNPRGYRIFSSYTDG